MNPEQWDKLAELFESARQRPPIERASFLLKACGDDLDLKKEVESLLAEDERLGGFMERPAIERGELLKVDEITEAETESALPGVGKAASGDGHLGTLLQSRYFIERRLGSGGMGIVYLGRDRQLHSKPVVIKFLRDTIYESPWLQKKFQDEIEALARINHPCVVGVSDAGTAPDGRPYFVMEFVEGHTLRSEIKPGGMDLARAATILRQVGQALEAAHSRSIYHLDLKPGNIMVQDLGDGGVAVKLIDFGIAKVRNPHKEGQTDITKLAGTIEYMAPEQLEGKAFSASDIYAMGVIAYEMVTGRRPFNPESPFQLLELQRAGVRRTPRALRPDLPEPAQRIILRALEFDVAQRPVRAKEFGDEFTRSLTVAHEQQPSPATPFPFVSTHSIQMLPSWRPRVIVFMHVILILLVAIIPFSGRRPALRQQIPDMVRSNPTAARSSIIVLPFTDLVGDQDKEYLVDGLADELITALTKIDGVRVVARSSAFAFKGTKLDNRSIAEKLQVRHLVRGTVRPVPAGLHVTVDLIDAIEDLNVWAGSYDVKPREIVTLPRQISRAVIEVLKGRLSRDQIAQLGKQYTENAEAYRLYQLGRHHRNKLKSEEIEKGIKYLHQAIAVDPKFALAYSGLADCYSALNDYGGMPHQESLAQARDLALRAKELDPTLGEAHASLGLALSLNVHQWREAEPSFLRAIELSPGYGQARQWYGAWLGKMGRLDEAIDQIQVAVDRDPLSLQVNYVLGWMLFLGRRYDQAISQAKKTLELNQDSPALYLLARAYAQQGMFKEALAAHEHSIAVRGKTPASSAVLACIYASAGRKEEALQIVNELIERRRTEHFAASFISSVYGILGLRDDAFEWLEKAFKESDSSVLFLKVYPYYESLRSDPRYLALLNKLRLL